VYKISYFSVAPGFGAYRTTPHPYKLIFQMKTKVEKVESSLISVHGLSLTKIVDMCSNTADFDYLVGELLLCCSGLDVAFFYGYMLGHRYCFFCRCYWVDDWQIC